MQKRIFSTGAAILMAASLTVFAATATQTDKTFVGKVSQGGMYEVEAGKVAQMRGQSPFVKDFGATEVHDHSGVNQQLMRIAAATGVPVAETLNAEFQARLDKLKSTSAADFDAAYVADMKQIHDGDEKLFAQQAQDGSQPYKMFAHQTDQIVKGHIGALQAQ